jgi:hypothetical protein
MKKLPSSFRPFLWSKSFKTLDKERDKIYIIHQILSYGDLKELRQLFRVYNRKEIKETFIRYPKKIYQPAVLYFIKNSILGLKSKRLKEEDYVKTLY